MSKNKQTQARDIEHPLKCDLYYILTNFLWKGYPRHVFSVDRHKASNCHFWSAKTTNGGSLPPHHCFFTKFKHTVRRGYFYQLFVCMISDFSGCDSIELAVANMKLILGNFDFFSFWSYIKSLW